MNLDLSLFTILHSLAGKTAAGDAIITFFATYLPFLMVGYFIWYVLQNRTSTRWSKLVLLLSAGFATLLSRGILTNVIRDLVPRDRPFLALDVPSIFIINEPSFPSGHAAFFFAFSAIVFAYNKRLGIIFFVLSTLVCVARVIAGVHYPSDILIGALVGVVSGYLTHRFLTPLLARRPVETRP
ncbi:MAG: phosphatase PAP2 family protein [Patescibacteria group bacterium]